MGSKKKDEGDKNMAERRKMRTEKGLALVPGANQLANGCNFAVEIPEGSKASLVLYKKRSAKPCVEIPFTEENRTGNVYMHCFSRILIRKSMSTIFLWMEKCIWIPAHTELSDGNVLERI